MTVIFVIFLVLAFLVTIVASIWLLVVAFRTSMLWGLATLLVPFASLLFVVSHWDDAKRPFLLNLVAGIFLLPAYFGLIANHAGSSAPLAPVPGLAEASPPSRRLPAAAPASPRHHFSEPSPGATPGAPPTAAPFALGEPLPRIELPDDDAAAAAPRPSVHPETVPFAEASRLIGRRVAVVTGRPNPLVGTLRAADEQRLVVATQVTGGSMTITLTRRQVREIRSLP